MHGAHKVGDFMIKTNILVLASAGALSVAGAAMAAAPIDQQPGPYVELYLGSGLGGATSANAAAAGLGSIGTDFGPKPGIFTSLAVGHSLHYGFAVEVEGLYTNNDVSTNLIDTAVGAPAKASTQAYGGLVDLMWAVAHWGPVVPYVGVGVGYGGVTYDLYGASFDDNGLMWQAKAGLSYPVSRKVSLDLGYRYLSASPYNLSGSFDLGGTTYSGNLDVHTKLHVVTAGVRVRF